MQFQNGAVELGQVQEQLQVRDGVQVGGELGVLQRAEGTLEEQARLGED